ncbi:MAG: efflux RND transporter permease subunit, partial [Alphaproteobacteria bacterium]
LMWPGVSGQFMKFLPIMVIIVLSASLLTAMVFLPVLGGMFGKSIATKAEVDTARKLSGATIVDYREIHGLTGTYVRTLKVLLRHPAKVLAAAGVIFYAVITYFAANNNGVEFFVDEEPEQAVVLISARGNLSARETRDLVIEVETLVLRVPGIENVFMSTQSAGGGIKVNEVQDKPADLIGQLIIELEDYQKRLSAKQIFAQIRELTKPLAGIHVEVRKIEGGPPTGKHVRLEITAPSYNAVLEAAGKVRAHVNQMTGLRDVEDTRPLPGIEWELRVDRVEAGRFGTDIASVGAMIQLVTNGILVGKYRPDDSRDEVDIRVRLPKDQRSIGQIDQLRIQTPSGLVPLSNLVTRKARQKVSAITRQNGQFAMLVKANVVDGLKPDDKVRELDEWVQAQSWPDDLSFRFRGADEDQKEAGEFLGKAGIAALFLMFIILVTQFNSFYQTILTLSTVLMSVIGVLLGMAVTGQAFSIIMTGTGIVALAGIVVNNSIVLMDTFNRLRDAGIEIVDAALRAAAQRIRPILLTTITTILGLVPMAIQININFFDREIIYGSITSIWWVQLSTAVIFGLAFSTLLTLILIPTLLTMPTVYKQNFHIQFDRWQKWREQKADKKDGDKGPLAPAGEPAE